VFKLKIKGASYYSDYDPIITMKSLDSAGVVSSNTSLIKKYIYRLSFDRKRLSTDPVFPTTSVGVTVARPQLHSAGISGSY
jgi:hypothetical protein